MVTLNETEQIESVRAKTSESFKAELEAKEGKLEAYRKEI